MISQPHSYADKCQALQHELLALPGALVAFSGGVDSTVLLHAAHAALGAAVIAVTADSPSLPRQELAEAVALARGLGVRHEILATQELQREGYRANALDRCYHCKNELFLAVANERARFAPPTWPVLYGLIADDLSDHRPGQQAAKEHGVLGPLATAGFSKSDVRRYAQAAGLPNCDKPSMACLASRVPFGTTIDATMLARIETAERALRALGLRQFRVRHHGDVARIEVAEDELPFAFAHRLPVGQAVLAAGYRFAALDAFGYRMGSFHAPQPKG